MMPNTASKADHRIFLGWDRPVLTAVVERLLQEFADTSTWDLRDLLIVLPGGVARRRLSELLALAAQREHKILYPPQIVTVGSLPENLYVAKFPFASDLVQNLAWVHALHHTTAADLQQLVPVPPPKSAAAQWLELAKILSGVHRELASDQLNFQKVAQALGPAHPETPRWTALANIQRLYLEELDRLELWDIQTARLCALDFKEPTTQKQIIVVACVDLNRTQCGFLEAVREHMQIWVAAPASKRDMFDRFGCLVSEVWKDQQLDLPPESLLVGNAPSDQAELTAACLAELGPVHVREVTLGVPDSTLVPELQHHLTLAGVKTRFGAGIHLTRTEPAMLLARIGRFVDGRSYADFASLIRHPAFENLLQTHKVDVPENWLSLIDDYCQAVLPKTIGTFINHEADGAKTFELITKTLTQWLGKLTARPQPVSHWVQPLLNVLSFAYEKLLCDLDSDSDGPLYLAATQVSAAIVALRDIPVELEPKMTVAELIDWLLRNMSAKLVPAPSNVSAVEMLGWLELALDNTPNLVVTGIHDGVVPESVNADAFLPNQLRRSLGIMDNARRYARDMYSLHVMLHSRQHIRFVVGKTDASGDPLVPSRLLMACDLRDLPSRVLHLVQEDHTDTLPEVERRWKKSAKPSSLIVPRPAVVDPPRHVTVTAFRDYLKCPYRFYLRHILKLRDEDDSDLELDAPKFGVLLHDTLQQLGTSPVGMSTDAEEVRDFLITHLQLIAEKMFGPAPPAAVLIQIEQAELRLEAFARHQAARAADGWQIRFVEQGVDYKDRVLVGNEEQLHLIGRIDRIDFQPATGQWAIWDYKTSDTAKAPVAVHWSRTKGWQDLQLPMYLPIAKKLGVTGQPTLGYIALPKQAADTGFYLAEFSQLQLKEAAAIGDEIASKIAQGEFWPEKLEPLPYDDFSRICQTQVQRVSAQPPARHLHRTSSTSLPTVSEQVAAEARTLIAAPQRSHPKFEPLLIRASAGTGKTFQLSNRLLQIILSGQEVDHILATTFTRKAAGEIMQRVLQRLAKGCLDADARHEMAAHLPGVDTSAAACLAALRAVTASIHRLRISTLDSFFAQVARTFSLEMGLPPGWNAMDPLAEPVMQMQAVSQMLDSHDRKTLVNLVRMLAKGESGRQVAQEILRTVSAGYEAFRTTTAEAWDQLTLPKPPSEAALESALITLERTSLNHKKADPLVKRLHRDASQGDWESVVAHGIYAKLHQDPPSYYGRELPAELIVALESLLDRAAAELLPIRRNQTLASYQVIAAYDAEYSSLIRRNRTLAFADVTYYLSKWINGSGRETTPGTEQLEFRLDCGVQHLLLDEFQDTSPDQWRILQPMAEPLSGPARSEYSFFCVGDTKQAIYGWRGGVAEIFDSVNQAMRGLKQQEMQQSFRSSPHVMQAVNSVFQNLPQHRNFADCESVAKRWSQTFPEHRTSRTDLTGYVRLQNGPKFDYGTPREDVKRGFLDYSAEQIAELTRISSASIGVLFRTNADVGRMIGLLRDKGVSASQDGGNPLTDSVAVELILSLVHLADHPGDGICAFHVGTSPLAKHLPFKCQSAPQDVANWFRRNVSRRGLGRVIEEIADHLADHLSWWDQHRLEQLIRSAHIFEANQGGRLREFEEAVLRDRVALPSESQVKVMTVHKSKGLEFDAVFLPDLEAELLSSNSLLVLRGDDPVEPPDGVLRYMNANLQAMLPKSWQAAFDQHKQRSVSESLCLLYVAMTRAKSALYMTARPTSSPPTQQFGSLLQSTLAASTKAVATVASVLYESGDAQWYERYPVSQPIPAATSGEPRDENQLAISLRADPDSAPTRGLHVAAPSSIHQSFEPVPLSAAFSYNKSLGATYGTLIHAWFEQIHWLDDFSFDAERLRRIALATIEPEALRHLNLERVLSEFNDMLQLTSVRNALSRDRYRTAELGSIPERVEIDNERVISLIMDERLISGTIDRLAVLMKDGQPFAAEIIDFKTDSYDPTMSLLWLDDRIEHHRPQLEVYAQVVSQLFKIPLEHIALYLVMLSTDDLVRVDQHRPSTVIPTPHLDHAKTHATSNSHA
ncbi:MAG: UvrD-helicase domain-containing protein [Pirellulaceae bacterium]